MNNLTQSERSQIALEEINKAHEQLDSMNCQGKDGALAYRSIFNAKIYKILIEDKIRENGEV